MKSKLGQNDICGRNRYLARVFLNSNNTDDRAVGNEYEALQGKNTISRYLMLINTVLKPQHLESPGIYVLWGMRAMGGEGWRPFTSWAG